MKSQYVSSEELNTSADIMLPLIDNMFFCRKKAVEEINKEFGTNITVEKDSAWEKKQIQSDMVASPDDDPEPIVPTSVTEDPEDLPKEGEEDAE